ncbi:hypothetical protein [Phenylobacterium kunshanense]|uniref:hypothetical protein n=1 Tax=Phenylobacterium kunshanense TaxID=1445034 RepID=UPI001403C565|nr:hypothetical protein [Phenylobacterium kunshanense]
MVASIWRARRGRGIAVEVASLGGLAGVTGVTRALDLIRRREGNPAMRRTSFLPALGFGAAALALLAVAQAPWGRLWPAPPASLGADVARTEAPAAAGGQGVERPGASAALRPDDGSGAAVAEMEARAGLPLYETFRWPLTVTRTGRPADATAVGLARTDGTSAGVIVINGRGALVQAIPGSEGPDGAAVAAAWLRARGWMPGAE